MRLSTAVRLGRVSNLPTVWSNVLAAAVLAGLTEIDARLFVPLVALSFAYTGGMYLNDAFDRHIDASERPERPIPAREIGSRTVFVAGFAQLLIMLLLVAVTASLYEQHPMHSTMAALLLVAAIVLYNAWHKHNPLSPVLMGLCRMLVYGCVALAVVRVPAAEVYAASLILFAWLIGLSCIAKAERPGQLASLWPLALLGAPLLTGVLSAAKAPIVWLPLLLLAALIGYTLRCLVRGGPQSMAAAVGALIAGIALVDAMLIAPHTTTLWVLLTVACCPLTLVLQRIVPGT